MRIGVPWGRVPWGLTVFLTDWTQIVLLQHIKKFSQYVHFEKNIEFHLPHFDFQQPSTYYSTIVTQLESELSTIGHFKFSKGISYPETTQNFLKRISF